MMQTLVQIMALVRLEMRKTFFARRGLWVYLLALAPVLLFAGNSIYQPRERARLARLAATHPVSRAALQSIKRNMPRDKVVALIGEPYSKRFLRRRGGERISASRELDRYTDGKSDYWLFYTDNTVRNIEHADTGTLSQDTLIFATIFQVYTLRLAIFFGCVGILMNLFRGEMLDKSLHFYMLAPLRREVLASGKYLAGLGATIVIFTISTALQFAAMLWQYSRPEVADYLQYGGWHQLGAYLGITALACLGYGSIFLAAGLIFRNPIVPAAVMLLWESANLFLPAALKQISLIYYLQSLCPVPASADLKLPPPIMALITTASPASAGAAIATVLAVTAIVLTAAALKARKLEINYSAE